MDSGRGDSRRRSGNTSFEEAWRERFGEFAALRDDDAGIAGWSTSGLETRMRFFRSLWAPVPAGSLYLDAGCGAGTYARWLDDQGLRAVGVDYSLPALVKARDRSPPAVSYCAADAVRLPFADAVFDGALCFGVLQAVSESAPVVRELARVLKPGAALWIDALNRSGLAARVTTARRRARGRPMHLRYEEPGALARALAVAGFDRLERHWLPIVPHGMRHLRPLVESRLARLALSRAPILGGLLSHAFVYRATRAGAGPQPVDAVGPRLRAGR